MVAVAIGGAALVGGVATVSAGNKAANAQKDAAAQADATNRYIYDTNRTDFAPYRTVGEGALYKLADMYGVSRPTQLTTTPTPAAPMGVAGMYGVNGGTGFAPATNDNPMTAGFSGFQASPGYQFRVGEAMKAIERSAAARGNLRSGATMDALQRRVQGEASSEYENYANRLAALAGVGQSATSQTAAAGQAYAGQQTQTQMAAGNARASAYANTGSAINNGIQNVASAYLYNKGFGGAGGVPPYNPTINNVAAFGNG